MHKVLRTVLSTCRMLVVRVVIAAVIIREGLCSVQRGSHSVQNSLVIKESPIPCIITSKLLLSLCCIQSPILGIQRHNRQIF